MKIYQYISPGMIRVSSETIEALKKRGMDLQPVHYPLFEIKQVVMKPLKPVKELRFQKLNNVSCETSE